MEMFSAFTHKGGVHVAAVRRNPRTYEHIEPELVGNKQRILLSISSTLGEPLVPFWVIILSTAEGMIK